MRVLWNFSLKNSLKHETEVLNIKKNYRNPFFLQLDISNLMRQNHLENELKILLDDGYFNEILTLKDEQIMEENFTDFKIYIKYLKNSKSQIKITKFL